MDCAVAKSGPFWRIVSTNDVFPNLIWRLNFLVSPNYNVYFHESASQAITWSDLKFRQKKFVKQSNTKNSAMRKMTTIIRKKSDKSRFLEASLVRKRTASLKSGNAGKLIIKKSGNTCDIIYGRPRQVLASC